jgi:hypothetical protein
MSDEKTKASWIASIWRNETTRRWMIRGIALLAAFLLGFVPMWLSSRENARSLAQSQLHLKRNQMQNTLALAVIDARRGEYETARQTTSDFFTQVRTELDINSDVFSSEERTKIAGVLSARDEIITMLSRADSVGAERLSDFYVDYRNIVNAAK